MPTPDVAADPPTCVVRLGLRNASGYEFQDRLTEYVLLHCTECDFCRHLRPLVGYLATLDALVRRRPSEGDAIVAK